MDLSLQDLLQYTDEGEDMLNMIVTGGWIMGASLPTQIKACFNAMESPYWQMFCRWWRGWNRVVKLAETTVKNFYVVGFEALVKQCDKCISVGWGYAKKLFFFWVQISHVYVLHPFATYLLTLLCNSVLVYVVSSATLFLVQSTRILTRWMFKSSCNIVQIVC
jgi:hypothetical protein